MSVHSEIDDTLRQLGSVEPPPGLEQARINRRLQASSNASRNRFSARVTRTIATFALAASVALSAVVLNPALRSRAFHHAAAPGVPAANTPRVVAPVSGGFGTASAVHVPVEPVPVQPTPVNQGRGRSRSGRAVLPQAATSHLCRGELPHPTLPLPPLLIRRTDFLEHCLDNHVNDCQHRRSNESGAKAGDLQPWSDLACQDEHERIDD